MAAGRSNQSLILLLLACMHAGMSLGEVRVSQEGQERLGIRCEAKG